MRTKKDVDKKFLKTVTTRTNTTYTVIWLWGGSRALTFHQDNQNVPDDGESGDQDKYREQEGADWVGHLVLWLKEVNNIRNKYRQTPNHLLVCSVFACGAK